MKKLPIIVSLVLFVLLLASCGDLVVPVAYVRFEKSSAEQYVVYSSVMGATSDGHIGVWKNEEEYKKQFGSEDLAINYFPRCMGTDDIDDVRYILMDLSKGYREIHISVDKEYYDSASRSLYLNGAALTPTEVKVDDPLVFLTYEDVPLRRTNPHGHMDYDALNVLEYK